MKKLFALLIVITMLFGCGNTGQKKISIAIIGKADVPYWNSVKIGAEAAGKILGVSVKYLSPAREDAAWQLKKVEELIADKIDGMAFAASDPKSMAPAIKNAMQDNIPCVAIDNDVAKSRHLYIGTGNYYAGQEAGQIMASLMDNKGQVAILGNSTGDTDPLQRVMGFRDVLAEYISLNVTANIDEEDGAIKASQVESLFEVYPLIGGIFCVSDSSAVLAAQAIQNLDKAGQVKIICIGESDEVMKFVRNGVIQAAIARRPYRMGYLSVLALHNMVRVGIENALMMMPESGIVDTGIAVIDLSNIDQYREQLNELGIKAKF